MKLQRHHYFIAAAAGVVGLALGAEAAFAIEPIVPLCARQVSVNPPDFDCVLRTFKGIARLVTGISGSAALLMFVYGGFEMIISAGNSDRVKRGKTILMNAIIGLFIIFTAGYVVDYLMAKLTNGTGVMKVGSKCNGGKGTVISSGDGSFCQTPCSAMADQGYACKIAGEGLDCNADNSKDCPSGQQCCR